MTLIMTVQKIHYTLIVSHLEIYSRARMTQLSHCLASHLILQKRIASTSPTFTMKLHLELFYLCYFPVTVPGDVAGTTTGWPRRIMMGQTRARHSCAQCTDWCRSINPQHKELKLALSK